MYSVVLLCILRCALFGLLCFESVPLEDQCGKSQLIPVGVLHNVTELAEN